MATTKFYLDLRGKAKDRKGSILISLYHNNTTTTIATGIRVLPEEWNGMRVVNAYNAESLNAELLAQMTRVNKSLAYLAFTDGFDRMTASQLKKLLTQDKNPIKEYTVEELFREYMSTDIKPGTVKIYNSALKKIISFSGSGTRITDIDLKWLRRFDSFLSRTQGANGRSIYMRCLRAVCNYARHTGVIQTYPFDNFQIKHEHTRKRCVCVKELRELISYKVSPLQETYRDYFLLMFYLIGINAKDLLLAKHESVVNGRLEYIRAKTGKRYSIKIEPEAQAIIDRHKGNDWLLDALDHCQHYQSFLHMLNDSLKEIGEATFETVPDPYDLFGEQSVIKKIKPLIPGLSTYYARHSWATIAYEIGIPIDVISQALGHSDGNRTTLIYVKYNQEKVDDANRKVIDYVLYGIT